MTMSSVEIGGSRIIVVFGKVGVGKTSVAEGVAQQLDCPRLSSDDFRKKRFKGQQYEESHSVAAMADMLAKASWFFEKSRNGVVLDATFSKRKSRDRVRELAGKYGREVAWVEVVCPTESLSADFAAREKGMGGNIAGAWVAREADDLADVAGRLVVDNSDRRGKKGKKIRILVEQICHEMNLEKAVS